MPDFVRRHGALLFIAGLGLAAGAAVWRLHGPGRVLAAFGHAGELFFMVLPALLAGLLLSASLRELVPSGALAKWMGAESGWRGLLLATLAGIATPGGPIAAFPLVLVLARAGADKGALIAFTLAWSLNGFQRVLVWEMPLLGVDFALLRFLCGLPLPPLCGWLARRIPIAWSPPEADGPEPRRP